MFHRFFLLTASLFVLSCSTQSKEIEVVYEIKKMNDWNFDVSLSILNSTNVDFSTKNDLFLEVKEHKVLANTLKGLKIILVFTMLDFSLD